MSASRENLPTEGRVVIGLSAVVVAIQADNAVVLSVRPPGASLEGLPFGPFDPLGHRTFELAMRAFVTEQTRFTLGYVEQLYTFGDKGRDAPLADMGDLGGQRSGVRPDHDRVISVGYLALAGCGGRHPRARLGMAAVVAVLPLRGLARGSPGRPGADRGRAAPLGRRRPASGPRAPVVRLRRRTVERGTGAGAL